MSEQNAIVYVKRDADEGTPVNPPMLWMLIEYRTRNKVTNYEVVAAKDVCGGGGSRANSGLESMHTGKLIYVKKDTGLVQATIVTISDDKQFLNNELKDLVEMQKEEYEIHSNKKRKRVSVAKLDSVATSSAATQYTRWNSGAHDTGTTTQNGGGGAMNKQSVIKSNPNVQNYPPMTFDQQTQTDFKATADFSNNEMRFSKILATEEDILRDVHSMTEENHDIKQQVADLRVEVAEIKTLLKDISEKLTHQNDGVHSTSTDFNRTSSILNSTQTSSTSVLARTPHVIPPRILNLSHQSNYTPHTLNYNSISIEPVIEASNDSNFSYSNHSRMSLSASNQSIYQADTNHNESAHLSAMKLDYSSNNSKNADSFADDEGDPNEEVVIGPNHTTVTRNVLTNINWNSHTAATRRLLRAKFSREVLATHSLTGKPSPAFIESSKPTKNQLNPKIIADIVQYVAKRCKVTDTAVRSSITTKCADENKMMRQRNDKNRKSLVKIENKENVEN
ncbi:protein insensitive-like [Sitodiplosis mosellana]|uniref:protein insensitive-like n=1 Tax=Sitodiplosis mosellana TaxID=263140 RepID=UPI002443C89A|nr:protein insensitive-like [Sitodiplosis mosellana]XP_055322084.1 protein insensitive-like [Sitodiplosis mosellana]